MPPAKLNQAIQDEISRLSQQHELEASVLETFAHFVVKTYKQKDKQPAKPKAKQPAASKPKQTTKSKALTLPQLKKAVYQRFEVKNTPDLKKSSAFKMATDGMDELNLSLKSGWELLYRKFIGVLPGEEEQSGYGCINGINIFDYFRPWQVFGLDPKKATPEDIKASYRNLSKQYHPDIPNTGDAKIFDRINTMYKSISAEA